MQLGGMQQRSHEQIYTQHGICWRHQPAASGRRAGGASTAPLLGEMQGRLQDAHHAAKLVAWQVCPQALLLRAKQGVGAASGCGSEAKQASSPADGRPTMCKAR